MIPARFSYEFPERCMRLFEKAYQAAQEDNLATTFAIVVAMPLLLVPFQRMRADHPLREHEEEPGMHAALDSMREEKFLDTPLWCNQKIDDWRLSTIRRDIDRTDEWRDSAGHHPCSSAASNEFKVAKTDKILTILRNSLAHGNIVYLDSSGRERADAPAQKIGFVSMVHLKKPELGYRVLIVSEKAFLQFLREWANWIGTFRGNDYSLALAA